MSVAAVNAVFELDLSKIDAGAKVQLVYLAWRSDKGGIAWPSVETIAAALSVTTRTVQRNTKKLQSAGLISCQVGGGAGNANRYVLTYPGVAENPDPSDGVSGAQNPDAAVMEQPDVVVRNPDASDQIPRRTRHPIDTKHKKNNGTHGRSRAEADSTKAWSTVKDHASGPWRRSRTCGDPIADQVVQAMGGWHALAMSTERDLSFRRREFFDAYHSFSRRKPSGARYRPEHRGKHR